MLLLSDYRLISYHEPYKSIYKEKGFRFEPNIRTGGYAFKNTVKLISINSAVVEKYLGVHSLSDYKLRKVRQNLEAIIQIDIEALCFKEVPPERVLL